MDAQAVFRASDLERAERYERFLHVSSLLSIAGQLAVAAALAVASPRLVRRLWGGPVVRGMTLLAIAYVALWVARRPFWLASLWWRRRYGVAREGYLESLVYPWPTLLAELALGVVAVAALMLLARRLGSRSWLAGAGAVAVLGTAFVVLNPLLLAPRFAPLPPEVPRAGIEALAGRMGVGEVEVRLRRASTRTRAANAEVVGLGPTRRIVLWDTLIDGGFSRGEIEAIAAHELAHVARRHVWKGLGWFLLAVVPAVWLLDRAARLRGGLGRPEAVPAVIVAGLALQLAITPGVNLLTRHYEREADWVALEATRDPDAMVGLLTRLATTNLADPEPPRWWALTFRTHPTILTRIAMAEAWAGRHGGEATATPGGAAGAMCGPR